MVRIEFVGYGGVVGRLWPLFFLFFPSPICGFEWSMECRGGGGWVFADLVVVWVVGEVVVVWFCEIVKILSFC